MVKVETVLIAAFLVWAVATSGIAAHSYLRITQLEVEISSLRAALSQSESELRELRSRVVVVNIAIDYGNGTVRWFNETPLPRGATVLKALLMVAGRVEYEYGAWGAYVKSVDGVAEKLISKSEGYSWLWYIYDREKGEWVMGPIAADAYELKEGATIKWAYEHWKF